MSKQKLEKQVEHAQQELDRERQERNHFQLQYDKGHNFRELICQQLEEKKKELRHKDQEMEEAGKQHQLEIKAYKQKVKHLLYEHQENLTELKAEGTLSLKQAQEDHWAQEMEMKKEVDSLKAKLREQELAHETLVKNLLMKQEEEITQLRQDFEKQVKEIKTMYSEKMQIQQDKLHLQKKLEICEVEERKNRHINDLMRDHEKAFNDIKNYYEDINHQNQEHINLLKEQKEKMKKRENKCRNEKAKLLHQNEQLKEMLEQTQKQMFELQEKLTHRDKEALKNVKGHLKITQKELKDLQWEHEVLVQRFSKVQEERDELYQKFTKAINEVQQKTGFKNLLLERKLKGLHSILERKEMELSEVLAASNLDPSTFSLVSQKLEDVLKSKDTTIKDLQLQLARACKAHNDMLQAFKGKLTAFGIPLDNLGFKPLERPEVGQGPAGLVSVPNWCKPTPRDQLHQSERWALPPLCFEPLNRPW
ncbi:dynein regulatory complex subunit 4-like [Phaenicophaeus curvirostris]|uniref:dynein regulatory complex subunit 4-like n=1 Tax=Phaenicophaeus curvirostris TaxID=33595 RepID=UPI0037F0BD1A